MNKWQELVEQARALTQEADALLKEHESKELPAEKEQEFNALMTQAGELQKRAIAYKALELRDSQLQTLAAEADVQETGSKSADALYALRYGEDKAQAAIMADLVGKDFRQKIANQNVAFAKYLRKGDAGLDAEERKILTMQVFPWEQIATLLKAGLSITEIKTTMVEAQGSLGGYAVPPNVQQEIAARLPGRAVVRSAGATVIDLMSGNATDVPTYTGGNARYRGNIRGVWGSETTSPSAQNATLGTVPVVAQVYTYKVGMSQSLVEDAANLVALVQNDITAVLAIDEDEAFLIGDGANKPLGLLPSSANGNSLATVNSGNASSLTADGIIGLSDGIDEQYMEAARFVFNKATGTVIRKLKDGTGAYLFDRDIENNKRTLSGYPFNRSEAMPDVASSAYPILFGDYSGYWIVQRAGLTIVRYQDSNTGPNKVEYHVRRRVGGRPVQTWQFCAQYVSA